MIAFEVILWLLLTLFLIAVPLYLWIKKYRKPTVNAIIHWWTIFSKTIPKEKITKAVAWKKLLPSKEEITTDEITNDPVEAIIEESIVSSEKTTVVSSVEETIEDILPTEKEKIESKKRVQKEQSQWIDEKKHKTLERIKYAALTYKERGKLDQYEKKLVEWLALVPDHDEFLDMLSNHYFQQWNDVKALSLLKRVIALEKAITLKWDNPKYLISLVEIHYENKELKEAITIMEKLSKLRPTNIDYLLTLWTLYEEVREPTNAQKYYMKVLEIEPHNEHAKKSVKRLQ